MVKIETKGNHFCRKIQLPIKTLYPKNQCKIFLDIIFIFNLFTNFQNFCAAHPTTFGFWFDFCFTARQHILVHFGRGRLH